MTIKMLVVMMCGGGDDSDDSSIFRYTPVQARGRQHQGLHINSRIHEALEKNNISASEINALAVTEIAKTMLNLQAMEKRGLLGAIAMAAVQNLHSTPNTSDTTGNNGGAAAAGATPATSNRGGKGSGHQNSRQSRKAAPKASVAVADMLKDAVDCSDMDEIFKSLSAVLAEAQEESRQVKIGSTCTFFFRYVSCFCWNGCWIVPPSML